MRREATMNPSPTLRSYVCHLLGWLAAGAFQISAATAGNESDRARPDLVGIVRDEGGRPLAGATVFIHTAGPREGTGVLCPSCYADCRKRTGTDSEGRFKIESLDPDLVFRVLVVAKGRQPEFASKVDPAQPGPLAVALKPTSGGETAGRRLQGRLVDGQGKAVVGAVVNLRSVTRERGTQFGGNTNLDPVAVSDASGGFVLNGREDFRAAGIEIEARGFAKAIFADLNTGGKIHELKLTEGGGVRGRVLRDGKPVSGVVLGLAGANRASESFIGDFSVATDVDGRFLFANLPPRTDCFLYGRMESLAERGAIPAQQVRTGDDGAIVEVGDLLVRAGFVVAGQIRLTDGQPVPAKTQVMLSRSDAWDQLRTEADGSGRFRFVGVPAESISISTRIKGYRLSLRNRSLEPYGSYSLEGRIDADKPDLVLEFEPGDRREGLGGNSQVIRQEPMRGAEQGTKPDGEIVVTGTVVDADTGKPIPEFTVVEGRLSPYGQGIEWMKTRRTDARDGVFSVQFARRPEAPAVMLEAPGYIPRASGPIGTNGTNFSFTLKQGTGPTGILRLPDGNVASNMTVYLADLKNGVYVADEKMEVRENVYRETRRTRTDERGRFSFEPLIDGFAVVVVAPSGYAEVRLEDLQRNPEVRLQAHARVEGRLMIGAKPAAGETVRLGLAHLPYGAHPRNFPALQLYLTTRTDDDGRFTFERVPPIAVEVYHEPKVRDSRQGTIAQAQTTKFALQAGETRRIELGGKGRPVIGKLVVNGYDGEINFRSDVHNLESQLPAPDGLPDPMALSKEFSAKFRELKTDAEKTAAMADYRVRQERVVDQTRAFYKTDAGRAYHFAKRRDALNFSTDGAFRIEDIPGGKYSIKVELRQGTGDSPSRYSSPVIAMLSREIEVPDSPGGRSDEPYDLGTLTVEARAVMEVGKKAPDFAVTTLDGRTVKRADFSGKYLLLDFWAVWCGPCVAETPYLKEAWETFKDDSRFAMMGLSLDPEISAPRDYAAKHQLGWIQGFLGEWSTNSLPERYGVQGIPSIFLIGPDGKIVAKDLRGNAIKSAVAKALKP